MVDPAVVICLGQAGGRSDISIERVAINVIDVSALGQHGVPASVSQTAGTYNCNAIFYGLSHYIAECRPGLRGGLVHVPYLPEMAARHPGAPSLALDTLIAGVRVMVATTLAVEQDIREGAGALH